MDQRKIEFQPLTICQKLINMIMSCLASQPYKTVKLGSPRPDDRLTERAKPVEWQAGSGLAADQQFHCLSPTEQVKSPGASTPQSEQEPPLVNSACVGPDAMENIESTSLDKPGENEPENVESSNPDSPGENEREAPNPGDSSGANRVQKTVSFDHKIEIIKLRKRKTMRMKPTGRTSSKEHDIDEIKVYKPILRMGSSSNTTSESNVQQTEEEAKET